MMKFLHFTATVLSFAMHGMELSGAHDDGDHFAVHRRTMEDYEKLWAYQPVSIVTDNAAIDLDIRAIQEQLALKTDTGYTFAERLYSEGAHSRPIAVVTLDKPLDQDIPKNSLVQGLALVVAENHVPQQVRGIIYSQDAKRGEKTLWIAYETNAIQESYVGCQVGANPSPVVDGCFAANGSIYFPEIDDSHGYGYSYNVTQDNINDRTIQSFSTQAEDMMANCDDCPMPHFQKFYQYFGKADYGEEIINAALDGRMTDLSNGNMDLGAYSKEGRAQVYQQAMIFIHVWMWVVHELEHAIDICERDCQNPDSERCLDTTAVHDWDMAVAYYTGSRMTSETDPGTLLFHAAQWFCAPSNTCGEDGDDAAMVNQWVFRHFNIGQRMLRRGNCSGAHRSKEIIVSMMVVPLVQGTLQFAYEESTSKSYDEKRSAHMATFALSVLPIVHTCNAEDAAIIHRELKASNESNVDFQAVKSAFERNYPCMNIRCTDVGGIFDPTLGKYVHNGQPCEDSSSPDKKDNAVSVGIAVGGVAIVGFVFLMVKFVMKKKHMEPLDNPEKVTTTVHTGIDDSTMTDLQVV